MYIRTKTAELRILSQISPPDRTHLRVTEVFTLITPSRAHPCTILLFLQNISTVPPCLHVFNINGELLQEKELSESVNDITIVDKYLITGNARGFLAFRDLYRSATGIP